MRQEVSQVHYSANPLTMAADAKEIAAVFADKFGLDDVRELVNIGMGWRPGVLQEQVHHYKMAKAAMDSSTMQSLVTTASIATPVQFLQNWLPGFVKVITASRDADDLWGFSTTGSWEDEQVVQPILENTGTATLYGDTTNVPLANWNVNYNTRDVVRFELGLRVGLLEEARAARARINSGEMKRESAALNLEINRNLVAFYGYNGGNNQTYGGLNDPGLPAYIEVATGVLGFTWNVKTMLEICADIRNAIVQLRTQSKNTIDPKKVRLTLGIASAKVDYLSTISNLGISVADWLASTYPLIRVVSVLQFNAATAGDDVFYLFADTVPDLSSDDQKTFLQVVPSKFQILGIQKMTKGYEEDYGNATAGMMVKRPYAIVRYYNI